METKSVNVRHMPAPLWQKVKVLALEKGVQVHVVVVQALADYLEKEARK